MKKKAPIRRHIKETGCNPGWGAENKIVDDANSGAELPDCQDKNKKKYAAEQYKVPAAFLFFKKGLLGHGFRWFHGSPPKILMCCFEEFSIPD